MPRPVVPILPAPARSSRARIERRVPRQDHVGTTRDAACRAGSRRMPRSSSLPKLARAGWRGRRRRQDRSGSRRRRAGCPKARRAGPSSRRPRRGCDRRCYRPGSGPRGRPAGRASRRSFPCLRRPIGRPRLRRWTCQSSSSCTAIMLSASRSEDRTPNHPASWSILTSMQASPRDSCRASCMREMLMFGLAEDRADAADHAGSGRGCGSAAYAAFRDRFEHEKSSMRTMRG